MTQNNPPIELEAAATAFVVIDMQNDYCSPGGDFDKRGIPIEPAQSVLPNIRQLLDAARSRELFVLFTAMVFDEFTYEDRHHKIVPERMRDRKLCFRGTWGADVMDELVPLPGEMTIEKCRYSAFYNTNLEVLLRNRGITTLVLTGVVTNVCVESTTRHAYFLDYYCVVPEDSVAAYGDDLHEMALKNIDFLFGEVTGSDRIIEILSGAETTAETGASRKTAS